MGYSVRITAEKGRTGELRQGRYAPAWASGTWYPSPQAARKAASSWVSRHPGGKAEILRYTTREVVEILTG